MCVIVGLYTHIYSHCIRDIAEEVKIVVKKNSPITCDTHCFCVRFNIPKKQWLALRKETKKKEYKNKLEREIEKEKIGVSLGLEWGTLKKKKKGKLKDYLFAFRLRAKNSVDYKEICKAFPSIQKRIEALRQYGVKEFEAMACTEFGFSLNAFKPVGQLPILASLPLTADLTEKLGSPKLTAFGVSFDDSPLGLENAIIDFEEEENNLSITISSSFLSESMDKLIANAYEHVAEIAKLFVVKKK